MCSLGSRAQNKLLHLIFSQFSLSFVRARLKVKIGLNECMSAFRPLQTRHSCVVRFEITLRIWIWSSSRAASHYEKKKYNHQLVIRIQSRDNVSSQNSDKEEEEVEECGQKQPTKRHWTKPTLLPFSILFLTIFHNFSPFEFRIFHIQSHPLIVAVIHQLETMSKNTSRKTATNILSSCHIVFVILHFVPFY